MSFQTSIQEFLLKSQSDENMNNSCGSYPSPPMSPKYPNVFIKVNQEELEESLKIGDCEKENISFDSNANHESCIGNPIYKPSRGDKLKRNKSSKLAKEMIYPNHSRRGRTGSNEQGKRNFNFKHSGYATHCFVCENMVRTTNLRYHLYFGHVKCEECGKIIASCLKFGNITGSKDGEKCSHSKLDWVFPPVDNLKRLLDEDDETFNESLNQYLKSLKGLSKIAPYKEAIAYCRMYLKEKENSRINMRLSESEEISNVALNNNTFSSVMKLPDDASVNFKEISKIKKPKSNTETKKKYAENNLPVTVNNNTFPTIPTASVSSLNKTPPKKLKTSFGLKKKCSADILPVFPENGFYLIVKTVIKECPNCYEPLDPQDLKFNTNNWLISTSCRGCSLLVFFLLDPPDGSESKLEIILT